MFTHGLLVERANEQILLNPAADTGAGSDGVREGNPIAIIPSHEQSGRATLDVIHECPESAEAEFILRNRLRKHSVMNERRLASDPEERPKVLQGQIEHGFAVARRKVWRPRPTDESRQ